MTLPELPQGHAPSSGPYARVYTEGDLRLYAAACVEASRAVADLPGKDAVGIVEVLGEVEWLGKRPPRGTYLFTRPYLQCELDMAEAKAKAFAAKLKVE